MFIIDFSLSCAIPDTRNEFLYITGSLAWLGHLGTKQVTQYGPEGFIADLPQLITGRNHHACAGYNNDQDNFVLLVHGGFDDDDGM